MSIITNGKHSGVILSKGPNQMTELEPLEKYNWLIHMQYIRGEINACKNLINEEIKRSCGRNEFAYYQKGIISKDEGKIQEALESFQICHKLNPKNIENIKQVGNCLFLLRRNKLALEAYLEAEKTSEKPNWEICHKLGECLFCLGELASAKDYARRAVQLGKQESSYSLLIKILVADTDLRSAVAVSNAALESCPDSVEMLNESGILYLRTGQIQNAFERLSSALALEPYSKTALLGIGSIIQSHEEYDVALSKYKLALSSYPESVPLWNNIGMCFYGKHKYVAAISCLKRALWFSPLNWRVLYNLGLVHLTSKQPASAFNFLCATVNLRPDNGHAFMLLGCSLLDLQDTENAARALKQATILAPEDAVVLLNASLCYYLVGNPEAAGQTLRKYIALKKGSTHITANAQELEAKMLAVLPLDNMDSATHSEQMEMEENQDESLDGAKEENGNQLDPDEV